MCLVNAHRPDEEELSRLSGRGFKLVRTDLNPSCMGAYTPYQLGPNTRERFAISSRHVDDKNLQAGIHICTSLEVLIDERLFNPAYHKILPVTFNKSDVIALGDFCELTVRKLVVTSLVSVL